VPDSRVRIQVLNGSRKTGLARLATERLRKAGYDVVSIGNAPAAAAQSIVLDRVGKRDIAERIAKVLTISRIETRVDTTLYLEATVILGSDWATRFGTARPQIESSND
jgi:alkyl hydroperoxide reductase subunit AhpF